MLSDNFWGPKLSFAVYLPTLTGGWDIDGARVMTFVDRVIQTVNDITAAGVL